MDSPPPNYNPNESMLNGGTESIMKVMGGGGNASVPTNYNETQSVLSGGIEPIQRVEGGGKQKPENETDISVRYVVNYDFEDDGINVKYEISSLELEGYTSFRLPSYLNIGLFEIPC